MVFGLHAFLLGLITGFLLALPPGPLAVAVLRQGLGGRWGAGLQIVAAATVMDCLYALLAAFASSALVVALTDRVIAYREAALAFQALCVLGLTVIGVRYLRQQQHPEAAMAITSREATQAEGSKRMGTASPFVLGILIALTNLALPTFMPALIGVIGYIHARGWLATSLTARVEFSFGFGCGTGVWLLMLLYGCISYRTRLSHQVISGVCRVVGGAFLISAGILAVDVVASTDWTRLLASWVRLLSRG